MSWDGLFASWDRCARNVLDLLGITPTSLCRLHTADVEGVLVADNSAMVSLLALHGTLRLMGEEEFDQACAVLARTLATPLSRQAHALQFVFSCDPEQAGADIGHALQPHRVTAANLGLDLDSMLTDWAQTLAEYCATEQTLIAVWTGPGLMSRAEQARARQQARQQPGPRLRVREAQSQAVVLDRMRDQHRAFVEELREHLTSLNCRVELLDSHAAVQALRRANVPDWTARDWRPCLPGDPLPLRSPQPGSDPQDASSLLPPTIARQIWPCPATVHEGRYVEVGPRLYAPVLMTLPPQTCLPFAVLFRSLLAENLPWRAAILLTGDGLRGQSLKSVAASILSFAAPGNRMLQTSYRYLHDLALRGETMVGLQICCTTWVRQDGLEPGQARKLLQQRLARLSTAIQSWGSSDTTGFCGDPLLAYTASLPAMTTVSPAVRAIAPLSEAIRLLPLSRPCSPWTATDLPLRTPDGRFMPIGLFSSRMASWHEVCFAGMGQGKSFLLNTINFCFLLRPGQTRLPWLTVIDIGQSCSGLIRLIRAALPPDRRHLAVFARLRNSRSAAINPFDTPLGCHEPLPNQANALLNLLALLCTPLDATAPADGVTDMLREALDSVYRRLAPEGSGPKPFDPWPEPDITRWLKEHRVGVDEDTTWWDIVAELFRAGEIALTVRAQRHAVPLLADLLVELNNPLIRHRFENIATARGESVPDSCMRHLTSALRDYPMLAAPTCFSLGAARVVALDLTDVTPRGGPAADRQSGIMYLLARFVGAGHFFESLADLEHIPAAYRAWHRKRYESLQADPKRLCYDEWHRVGCTDPDNPLSRQILADLTTASREARKYNLAIALYSQQMEDFPDVFLELATSIYILGAGTARQAEEVARRCGCNQAAHHALRHITRPTKAGASFIALYRTADGEALQHLTCTAGSYARWAWSTTTEDMVVRDRLYDRLGCRETLARLCRHYPEGSIKTELERRRQLVESRADAAPEDILDQIVAELERSPGA